MENIHVTRVGEGEHWLLGTDVATVKVSGHDTSGSLLLLESVVPPGGGPPVLHRHEFPETFYVLEGLFEFSTVDAAGAAVSVSAAAGDTVFVPSLAWHNFKNAGDSAGRFLAIHSTAVMEDFAREIGQKIDDPENPPKPEGPPSEKEMRKTMEIIGKYMEVMPPDKIQKKAKK